MELSGLPAPELAGGVTAGELSAVEVELTRKTETRVLSILRHLLARYDDVVYRVHPSAMTVVTRSAAKLSSGRSGS